MEFLEGFLRGFSGIFGKIFWEEFLVEIYKELMFLSRFSVDFVSVHRKKEEFLIV